MVSVFCKDEYDKDNIRCSAGINRCFRPLKHMDKKVKMSFWDTSGNTKLRELAKPFYKKMHGIILVYDVGSKDSFKNLNSWLEVIKEHASETCEIICVGHKIDLKKENKEKVDETESQNFCDSKQLKHFRTTATDSDSIE
jgi:Ras-related protein Rab-1A